ncbi:MAG: hypothetical protein O2944_06215 [Proteobacteria bacterium]|nr:hypothetical protein [Pseudomonadota bacterium]
MRLFERSIAVLALIFCFGLAAAAKADEAGFNADVSKAYAGYRSAVQYLRTGNPGLGVIELSRTIRDWTAVEKQTGQPPVAYQKDAAFQKTITGIGASLRDGLAKAEAGDAKAAGKAIGGIQESLYQLRKRNGVRLYSDCVTEFNHQMDTLYQFRHQPPDPAKPDDWKKAAAVSQEYARLLADCRTMAPDEHRKNPDFVRLFDGAKNSVESMPKAISEKNPGGVVNILRELRSFDHLIFYNWG